MTVEQEARTAALRRMNERLPEMVVGELYELRADFMNLASDGLIRTPKGSNKVCIAMYLGPPRNPSEMFVTYRNTGEVTYEFLVKGELYHVYGDSLANGTDLHSANIRKIT